MSKDEFVTALKGKGLKAGFANDGIPTVFVEDATGINSAHSEIKKLIKSCGYVQSYGISLNPVKEKAYAVPTGA